MNPNQHGCSFSSSHTFFSLRVQLSYMQGKVSLSLSYSILFFFFFTSDTFSKFYQIVSVALALQSLYTYPVTLPRVHVFKGDLAGIIHQARFFKVLCRAFVMWYLEVRLLAILTNSCSKIQKVQVTICKNISGGVKEERDNILGKKIRLTYNHSDTNFYKGYGVIIFMKACHDKIILKQVNNSLKRKTIL